MPTPAPGSSHSLWRLPQNKDLPASPITLPVAVQILSTVSHPLGGPLLSPTDPRRCRCSVHPFRLCFSGLQFLSNLSSIKLSFVKAERPWFSISTSGYLTKNRKQDPKEVSAHPCSQQHHLQKPQGGSNPSVHLRMDGWTKCTLSTQWNIIQPSKGREFRYMLQNE